MTEPRSSGVVKTNSVAASVARVQHSEPRVYLVGRIAAQFNDEVIVGGKRILPRLGVGSLGLLGMGRKADLHFTLIVSDSYSGIFGFDGQPTFDAGNRGSIRTQYYRNVLPSGTFIQIDVAPPVGMSQSVFAQKLVVQAYNFASHTLDYSVPEKLVGSTMVAGEYNSSSFVAGLLNSVMGHVPKIETPGYQTPGWESPVPASYFKGEALR